MAVRRISRAPPTVASTDFAVVPRSMPTTSAAACISVTLPDPSSTSATATPALEDWITTVTAAPISTSASRPSQLSPAASPRPADR